MEDVKAIIDRMKEATNSRRYEDLADKLGVKLVTINNWKKRGFVPEKNILKCVLLTNTSKEWLLTGEKSTISETKTDQNVSLSVSLLQAGAGEGVYNFQTQETLLSLNPKLFPSLTAQQLTAVEIIGDSMEPVLQQGDYIIISPSHTERATEDGIYAIRVEGMVKVKSLQFHMDGTIKIFSINPRYEAEIYDPSTSQVDFAILGKQRLIISR